MIATTWDGKKYELNRDSARCGWEMIEVISDKETGPCVFIPDAVISKIELEIISWIHGVKLHE